VPLSPSSIIGTGQGRVMLWDWEGNRKSGVALAMRYILRRFIHLRSHGLRKGDEHPAYTPHGVWHSFTFFSNNPNTLSHRLVQYIDKHYTPRSSVCRNAHKYTELNVKFQTRPHARVQRLGRVSVTPPMQNPPT